MQYTLKSVKFQELKAERNEWSVWLRYLIFKVEIETIRMMTMVNTFEYTTVLTSSSVHSVCSHMIEISIGIERQTHAHMHAQTILEYENFRRIWKSAHSTFIANFKHIHNISSPIIIAIAGCSAKPSRAKSTRGGWHMCLHADIHITALRFDWKMC